jgi:hypothetical protein
MSRMARAGLLAFVVGAFALPTEAAFSLVFYLAVMVPAAIGWRGLRPAEGAGWLALGLIIWSALSLLWGVDDGHRAWLFLLGAVATSVFVLVLREALQAPGWGRRLAAVVVWSGTANAVLVLLFHAGALLRGERILGWGMTRQPILGGSVMAVACLTAMSARGLGLPFADGGGRMAMLGRLAYPGAAIVTAGFVVAMQSRGALLGLVGGTLVLAWRRFRWRALMVAVGGAERRQAAAEPDDPGARYLAPAGDLGAQLGDDPGTAGVRPWAGGEPARLADRISAQPLSLAAVLQRGGRIPAIRGVGLGGDAAAFACAARALAGVGGGAVGQCAAGGDHGFRPDHQGAGAALADFMAAGGAGAVAACQATRRRRGPS